MRYQITKIMLCGSISLCCKLSLLAGSATWSANPTNGEWNIAANWMPSTVPNEAGDVATFGPSAITNLAISATAEIASIAFRTDATSYSLSLAPAAILTLSGAGIVDDSANVQTFVLTTTDAVLSAILLKSNATAGQLTLFDNRGGELIFVDSSNAGKASFTITGAGARQGHLTFSNNATAAEATIAIDGDAFTTFVDSSTAAAAVLTTFDGGGIDFAADSSAANSIILCRGGTSDGLGGGGVDFSEDATAAEAKITATGASVAGAVAAHVIFGDQARAGNAAIMIAGGGVDGAAGALLSFYEDSTAVAADITINPGTNGGAAGSLFFFDHSDGGTASIALLGGSKLDLGNRAKPGVTIGSLAGDGPVFLGPKNLTIGSNNQSTAFSGVLQDGGINQGTGGSLTKIGSGTVTLIGANTYTGITTVSAGVLNAGNKTGSATGAGAVKVNAGTLGGRGTIAGATAIGTGSGAGAFLAPAVGTNKQTTLTLQSALTLNADATYTYTFKAKKNQARTDLVKANGVTINQASMNLSGTIQGRMKRGTVLTLISNTSANRINGTFSNLPEGAIAIVNGNNLQASYHGGDGNDLTLTAVR